MDTTIPDAALLQPSSEIEAGASMPLVVAANEAADPGESAEALLQTVESMLQYSYACGESAEDWWARFSDYYRALNIEAATRTAFASRLDWLFCRHGETAWPGIRRTLELGASELG